MAYSKVILNDEVLMDVTQKTVTANKMLYGTTAIKNDGTDIVGTVPTKSSTDLTVSGATVTVPAGYYASAATKSVASGSAKTPATSIEANPSISVSSAGKITATVSASKGITPTVTAGYVSSGTSGTVSVTGSAESQLSTQAAKTVTPTEAEQTAVAAGKYTTGIVKVGAISSTYVGSDITQRSSTDLTASGATVNVPAGYYAETASKDVGAGSATAPANITGTTATVSTGTNTLTLTKSVSVTPVVTAGYVSAGTATNSTVKLTANVTTKAAGTYYPSASDQTISASQYLTGAQTIKAVATAGLTAANIKDGAIVKIGDSADDDRVASVTGTFTDASTVSDGQTAAGANQILSGYSAWVDGAEVKGGIVSKTSSNLTVSGATVTAPAGYYASAASKSVASMTLPTAAASSATSGYTSKATIGRSTSAQYINIPTGYNSAGAYYTISATPNGTATAPSSITGTTATVSTGTNTLTLTKTVSVTPSITTAGYISAGTAGNSTVKLTANVTTKAAATITPSETAQEIAAGTYLTGKQTIAAIPSTYVGSGVTRQTELQDNLADEGTVTAPAGYYAEDVVLSPGAATHPAPSISFNSSTGLVTASHTQSQGFVSEDNAGTTSATYQVNVMTLPTSTATSATSGYTSKATIGRSTSTRYINIPAGYNPTGGYYTISGVANGSVTAPSSISGTTATVSTGTNTLTLTKTVSVTPSVTTAGYISAGTAGNSSVSLTANVTTKAAATYNTSTSDQTISSGTYLTGTQTIKAVTTSNLTAANVKSGVTVKVGDANDDDRIASVTGTFTSASTVSEGQTAATADTIRSGRSAWVNGAEVKGTIEDRAGETLNVSTENRYITHGVYLSGDLIIRGVLTSNISAENIKYGKVITVGDGANNARIASVSGTFTKASTVSSGQTAAAAAQILSGYSAWVDGAEVKGSIATMTLPTTASSSATSGYAKKIEFSGDSSATFYINIPPGYNSAGGYYKINGVTTATFPSATSSSSNAGTNMLFVNTSTSTQYLNFPIGYNGTTKYYTIRPVTQSGISPENIKHGVQVRVGDAGNTSRDFYAVGTFTSSSTVSEGQNSADAGKILAGYSAWVNGAEVKGNIPRVTPPVSTDSSATSGYTSQSQISIGTSDQYLNLPTGYYPDSRYYKINGVPSATGVSF